MRNQTKKLLLGVVMFSSLSVAASGAFALGAKPILPQQQPHAKVLICQPMHMQNKKMMMRRKHHFDKKLSEQDAKIITQAHLIMHGQKNLQVGKISDVKTKHGKAYRVEVTTKDGSFVHNVMLNAQTGRMHPIPVV